ncbi:hypothetical protein H5410_047032, partial [Solanum commersonii]
GVPNAPKVQPPHGEFTNAEFRNAIRMTTMLIKDMYIARIIIHVQQFEKDKLKDKEEFRSKRQKTTCHESGLQKNENVNQSSFQQRPTGPAPSSTSAYELKNRVSSGIKTRRISELDLLNLCV